MGFRLSKEFEEKQKELHEKKYITIDDKRIHVNELNNQSVTKEDYDKMWMNSYARDEIYPKLTNDTLVKVAQYYKNNSQRGGYPCATYDEALIHRIVPELIKRIEELENFYNYFAVLHGKGLEIANWHMNGDLEPFDEFFDAAEQDMDR